MTSATPPKFDRAAIFRAAWIEVRKQQEYYRSLADILPMPATAKLLSAALKTAWRIARGQRAKAMEAAHIASPEYRAENEAKRVCHGREDFRWDLGTVNNKNFAFCLGVIQASF